MFPTFLDIRKTHAMSSKKNQHSTILLLAWNPSQVFHNQYCSEIYISHTWKTPWDIVALNWFKFFYWTWFQDLDMWFQNISIPIFLTPTWNPLTFTTKLWIRSYVCVYWQYLYCFCCIENTFPWSQVLFFSDSLSANWKHDNIDRACIL